jgi:hypothetical protein
VAGTRTIPEIPAAGLDRAHVAVEPETGIVTDCALTKASGTDCSDAAVGPDLLADELQPVQALADSAYGSDETRAALANARHTAIIKPIPLRPADTNMVLGRTRPAVSR